MQSSLAPAGMGERSFCRALLEQEHVTTLDLPCSRVQGLELAIIR